MSGFWEEVKYFFEVVWGDSWSGYESMGRYALLVLGAIIAVTVLLGLFGWINDRRFVASCYARGGHVHYSYRSAPGIGVIVGNVVVPTTSVITTMKFAPGKKADCKRCD